MVEIFTLGIDYTSTNVFVKDNCTAKSIFRKNKVNIRYMRCFDKMRISMLQANKYRAINTFLHLLQLFWKKFLQNSFRSGTTSST